MTSEHDSRCSLVISRVNIKPRLQFDWKYIKCFGFRDRWAEDSFVPQWWKREIEEKNNTTDSDPYLWNMVEVVSRLYTGASLLFFLVVECTYLSPLDIKKPFESKNEMLEKSLEFNLSQTETNIWSLNLFIGFFGFSLFFYNRLLIQSEQC